MKTRPSATRLCFFAAATLSLALGAAAQVSDRAAERQSLAQPGRAPATATLPAQHAADLAELRADRHDDSPAVTRLKFSDPTKPGTLRFTLPWADVKITGTDSPDVVIRSDLEKKRGADEVDEEGFRRLDEGASFEASESGNVITIGTNGDLHAATPGAEFAIEVPRSTRLIVRTQFGGDIAIANIDGDIDVNCMNGEVTLDGLSASTVVNTMNGEVTARFRTAPTKPVSITTMNGEIDLRLPADTQANVRLRTHNGSVRTNFPASLLQTTIESSTGRLAAVRDEIFARRAARAAAAAPRAPADPADPADAASIAAAATEAAEAARAIAKEATEAAQAAAREAEGLAREHAAIAREAARQQAHTASAIARASSPTAPTAPAAPEAPVARPAPGAFVGGKSITGKLNGGGVDIVLSSMNGPITLRKSN